MASVSTFRVQTVLLLLIGSAFWLAGCGSGGAAAPPGGGGQQVSVTLTASDTTIDAGELSTLTWTSTNATAITITPAVTTDSDTPLPLAGSAPVAPTQTTTYTVTATGPNGAASQSVTITVNQPQPEITTFVATPPSIIAGQSSTLSWGTEHATSLSIDQNVGSQPVPSGSVTVTPGATTTYTATANGPGGSTTATVTVTVAPAGQLAITVTVSPDTIGPGQSATLSWQSQNATSVSFDQGIGPVGLNGSLSVTPSQTTTYTATAGDGTNTQTASATVTVIAGAGVSKLKHIIFFMQENRSLDHYFGGLGRYRQSKGLPSNFDGLNLSTTLTDFFGHQVQSFHFQTTCHDNTSPGWNESHFFAHRRSDGSFGMDFWMMQATDSQHSTIDPHYTRTMGYYDERDIPYYYELATQFATSDRWFSSLMAPTVPNRLYLFTATSFGNIRPVNPPPGGFTQKTIFQLLNENSIEWKYYYRDSSVFLAQFSLWNDPVSQGRVRNISEYYSILADPNADNLLAPVVFLEQAAQTQLNEHPTNTNGIQPGAADTKKLIDALMASKAWPTSAFILTYDEAGGLYDHVPPISVPPPDNIAPIFQSGDIGQYDTFNYSGFRVPVVIVSPWVKKQHVSHDPMDFTAILWLIENRFGLPSLTARDGNAAANSRILDFFDFTSPAWLTPPTLPAQPTNGVCNRTLGKDANH